VKKALSVEVEIGRHTYVGPFFVGCDHRCGHGPKSHGVNSVRDNYCFDGFSNEEVRKICRTKIDSADLVFAWINRSDAYGTIWELGYAAAKNKKIVVRWPIDFDISEMWLALSADTRAARDVVAAFHESVAYAR
jgi:nucleoside 2-deoxyribosyltransferase